ncbi:hypothetical protein ACO0LB_11095 [Undibacterium sp. SXout7W]|uniref:hypothetical protein n=1 Tax=Undibacterium sp. SXout7W TaxID=3413049 RepID=UPI003BF06CC6
MDSFDFACPCTTYPKSTDSYSTSYVPPGSTDYQSYGANVTTGPSIGNVVLPDNQNGKRSQQAKLRAKNLETKVCKSKLFFI